MQNLSTGSAGLKD